MLTPYRQTLSNVLNFSNASRSRDSSPRLTPYTINVDVVYFARTLVPIPTPIFLYDPSSSRLQTKQEGPGICTYDPGVIMTQFPKGGGSVTTASIGSPKSPSVSPSFIHRTAKAAFPSTALSNMPYLIQERSASGTWAWNSASKSSPGGSDIAERTRRRE